MLTHLSKNAMLKGRVQGLYTVVVGWSQLSAEHPHKCSLAPLHTPLPSGTGRENRQNESRKTCRL